MHHLSLEISLPLFYHGMQFSMTLPGIMTAPGLVILSTAKNLRDPRVITGISLLKLYPTCDRIKFIIGIDYTQ